MRTRVPLIIAALVVLVLSMGRTIERPARAEVDSTVFIGCEFLVDTIDGDPDDVVQPADFTGACDGLSAVDVAALAAALGDADDVLEQADFAAIDLDQNQITDLNSGGTLPSGAPAINDEIYAIAFVDDEGVITFDAEVGLATHVNDSGGGLSADGDANPETCDAADDADCDNAVFDDGDGVVVATIVDASADAGDVVDVDVEQADDQNAVFTQTIEVVGAPDDVSISAVEEVIGTSDDAADCTEEADATDAADQISDIEKTIVKATVVDNDDVELTRIPVLFEAGGAVVIDETEVSESIEPSFDTGISVDFGAAGIAAFAVVCGDEDPGTGTVTATINAGSLTEENDTVDVTVVGLSDRVALVATPATIDCNGVSSSTVTAIVTDADGNPVADGTNVNFSVVALGTANPINAHTVKGVASSVITPAAEAGTGITVIVTADDAQASIRVNCAVPSPPQLTATPTATDTPTATPTNTPSPTPTPIPCAGDVNGDDRVTLKDLRIVVKTIIKQRDNADADLDGDGDVDMDDLLIVAGSLFEDCRTRGNR